MKKKLSEDELLLLKDLYGRMLYHVKVQYRGSEPIDLTEYSRSVRLIDCRPYLRPIETITEEERTDLRKFCREQDGIIYDIGVSGSVNSASIIDWLNSHHFDYRGLIQKGLAIEVTKNNNPYI